MFGKGADPTSADKHAHSILQDGMRVEGTIEAKGDVRLDGCLEGKLIVSERVTVGASGVLKADVEAGEAIIMGTVEGSIRVERRLELRKGARVVGDVTTPILVIEEGVHFHGSSNMRPGETPSLKLAFDALAAKPPETTPDDSRFERIYQ